MRRILVVDDDPVQVDVVSFLLRRVGFESTAAFDAATAARLFEDQQPDLVILDVHLGASDGLDLLRQFRKQGLRDLTTDVQPQANARQSVRHRVRCPPERLEDEFFRARRQSDPASRTLSSTPPVT